MGIKNVSVLFEFVFDEVIMFLFNRVGRIVCFCILVSLVKFLFWRWVIMVWLMGKLVINKIGFCNKIVFIIFD